MKKASFRIRLAPHGDVHSGSAFVGSFGGPMRSDYTAIGDTVNLASRMQAAAEPNQSHLSEEMPGYITITAHRRQEP